MGTGQLELLVDCYYFKINMSLTKFSASDTPNVNQFLALFLKWAGFKKSQHL